MRLVFVGAHGVGKTEIISAIKSELGGNLSFIENIASKELKKFNGLKPQDMKYEERNVFQASVFFSQVTAELSLDNFISDRSIIDAIVYSKGLKIQSFLKDVAKSYIKNYPYDKIYFIKNEGESDDYKDFIQFELIHMLDELKISYEILSGNKVQKLKKVISFIQARLEKGK